MTKLETYTQMVDHATERLTAEIMDWTSFLSTASRLYKYPFMQQVMIYTQRPNATACASYELWGERMNRFVRRGAKGIALIRVINGRATLFYVFDVADTGRKPNAIDVTPWLITEQNTEIVSVHLQNCFGVSGSKGLADQLIRISVQLAKDRWSDCKSTIRHALSNSFLEELDNDNIELQYRNAVTASIAYALLSRCGIDVKPFFTLEDFAAIGSFNTRDTVMLLGTAVAQSCEIVLRQIERAIQSFNAGQRIEPKPIPPAPTQSQPEEKENTPTAPVPAEPIKPEAQGQISSPAKEPQQIQMDMFPAAEETPEIIPVPSETVEVLAPPPTARPRSKVAPALLHPEIPSERRFDFRIEDDNLGVGTPLDRFYRNIRAIQLLKKLEAEERLALPTEQRVLSEYVGWGGLPQFFEESNAHYGELKAVLTEDEHASARASTLNAHFTTPIIIRAIYAAIANMGFVSGNILEPSCGVGNFFGCLPESMNESE